MEIRNNDGLAASVSVLLLATVGLLFVGLLAAAGFTVMAQRRMRALGMLAAIGASRRHIRLVLVAGGAVVGAVGGIGGAAIGLAGWFALGPALESPIGHRIDRFNLPWVPVGATHGMQSQHLTAIPVAWLVRSRHALTQGQVDKVQRAALAAGLAVEIRPTGANLVRLADYATGAGTAVALGVLAMTVGLIRSETARDLRTLTAAGARRGTRRALTGATAGGYRRRVRGPARLVPQGTALAGAPPAAQPARHRDRPAGGGRCRRLATGRTAAALPGPPGAGLTGPA